MASSGERGKITWGRVLLPLLIVFTLPVFSFAQDSGWIRKCSKRGCFYKPFAKVRRDQFVIFVTAQGKAYKGKCRKRAKNPCLATSSKRFDVPAIPMTYVVFEPGHPPAVVRYGEVDPFNEISE